MLKKLFIILIIAFGLTFVVSCKKSNNSSITSSAVTKTYTVKYAGPGGHSNGAYGNVNAVHAAGRALDALNKTNIAAKYRVSNFSGGNSVNSIAATGNFIVTATGSDADLEAFLVALTTATNKGMNDENAFRNVTSGQTNSQGGRVDIRVKVEEVK